MLNNKDKSHLLPAIVLILRDMGITLREFASGIDTTLNRARLIAYGHIIPEDYEKALISALLNTSHYKLFVTHT